MAFRMVTGKVRSLEHFSIPQVRMPAKAHAAAEGRAGPDKAGKTRASGQTAQCTVWPDAAINV